MNITARVDDAVRALIQLARAGGMPLRMTAIAQAGSVPASVLVPLLGELRRHGLVDHLRGSHGGYRLAKPPRGITVGDVVRAVDGPLASVGDMHPASLMYSGPTEALRTVWLAVHESLSDVLDDVTLEDLRSGRLSPRICDIALRYGLVERA